MLLNQFGAPVDFLLTLAPGKKTKRENCVCKLKLFFYSQLKFYWLCAWTAEGTYLTQPTKAPSLVRGRQAGRSFFKWARAQTWFKC